MNVCSARQWECVIWTGEAYTAFQPNCQHRCPVPSRLLWLGVGGFYVWWVLGCSSLVLAGLGGLGSGISANPLKSRQDVSFNLHSVPLNLVINPKEEREIIQLVVYPKHFEKSTQRSVWELLAWFSRFFWSRLGCLGVCWVASWLLVIAANSWYTTAVDWSWFQVLNADRHYHKHTPKQLIEADSIFLLLIATTTNTHQSSWLK